MIYVRIAGCERGGMYSAYVLGHGENGGYRSIGAAWREIQGRVGQGE